MDGIIFIEHFIKSPIDLFDYLTQNSTWDKSMKSRKTASFGVAYNYSQIHYPFKELPPYLVSICQQLKSKAKGPRMSLTFRCIQ